MGVEGIEPSTTSLSVKCSANELHTPTFLVEPLSYMPYTIAAAIVGRSTRQTRIDLV